MKLNIAKSATISSRTGIRIDGEELPFAVADDVTVEAGEIRKIHLTVLVDGPVHCAPELVICQYCGHPVGEHVDRWCRVRTGAVTADGAERICCCEGADADE